MKTEEIEDMVNLLLKLMLAFNAELRNHEARLDEIEDKIDWSERK